MQSELKKIKLYDPVTDSYHLEPKTDKEADTGPDKDRWYKSKEEELAAMDKFGVFELVTELPERDANGNKIKLMGAKFVYKLKTGSDGNITKFKSRLVARGFLSREGIDHDADEMFAPVMAYDTFRVLLSTAAGHGWQVHQLDVSNAYLQGELRDNRGNPRPLYMNDPLGRKDENGQPYYLKLKKPIYGLKQSAQKFNQALTAHLLGNGFTRAESDSCLFTIKKRRSEIDPNYEGDEIDQLMVGCYVDDLTYTGSSPEILKWFSELLESRFVIRPGDRGKIEYMLGTRIRQDLKGGTLTMDQTAAIEALAKRYKLHTTVPNSRTTTPINVKPLPKQISKTDDTGFEYLSAVGSLLFISGMTRPDISYAVGAVARHGSAYGEVHVKAVKQIITYLYHTRHLGITYRHQDNISQHDPLYKLREVTMFQAGRPPMMNEEGTERVRNDPLHVFCDADFGGDTTMRSTTGIVTFLNCGPISWTSQLQRLQSLSTTESEIYSATEAIKDAAYLKVMLNDLGLRGDEPIPIHEDNSACVKVGGQNLKKFNKARHYVQRVNFLQERVDDRTAVLIQTPTEEEIADALTKPLAFPQFKKFRDILVTDTTGPQELREEEES